MTSLVEQKRENSFKAWRILLKITEAEMSRVPGNDINAACLTV